MAKWGHNLPAVLEPVGDICVKVYIPAHPDYVKLFVRAIRQLEVNRMYRRDEDLSARIVVQQWRDRTVTPLIEALANGTGLCGDDGECIGYPPFASFFSYFPQNPYTEPNLIPDGFLTPPFYINGKDNEHTLPTHENGDVIIDFAAVNLEPSWNLDNTPRIELCIEGSGKCELHFLNIAQGGAAIVSLDNPVDLGDILAGIVGDGIEVIDLNQDIISLPPESASEIIIEVDIALEGEHIVYIYFVPTVNDSLIPLAFGGGIRSVYLCGSLRPCGQPPPPEPPPLEGVTELKPQFQFTTDCGLEYRLLNQEDEIVLDWTPVEGWIENAALCFGGNMADPIDTYEAIKLGIYDAFNDLAKQVVSGRINNITVGSDGTVSDPTTGGVDPEDLPEDDPATNYDETQAAIYGGSVSLMKGIEKLFDRLDTIYGSVNGTPVTPVATAQEQIKLQFPSDSDLMDAAVSNYYSYRTTDPTLQFNPTQANHLYFYCKGHDLFAFNNWLLESSGYNAYKISTCAQLVAALAPLFWSSYFENGLSKPSTVYQEASCIPSPTEIVNIHTLGSNFTTYTSWKANHRLLWTVEGYFTDDDGDILDFWWYVDSPSLPSSRIANVNIQLSTGITKPTVNQVPYAASHKYQFTIDMPTASQGQAIINVAATGMTNPVSPTSGILLTIQDLGEISS